MIRCIIVEDEALAQDVIKNHLAQVPALELAGTYRNATEASEALRDGSIDLMFLDIHLPGGSGLHFLRSLADPPLVILTTAYGEYALESYELSVIDYLLKPISFERFSKAVEKVTGARVRKPETRADHLFVRADGKFRKIDFSEILYIQGMRDYLKICTPDSSIVTLQTMGEMERTLPSASFIRIHRSYIVSISRIRSIYGNTIELDKVALPIGVQYRAAVMEMVGKRGG